MVVFIILAVFIILIYLYASSVAGIIAKIPIMGKMIFKIPFVGKWLSSKKKETFIPLKDPDFSDIYKNTILNIID